MAYVTISTVVFVPCLISGMAYGLLLWSISVSQSPFRPIVRELGFRNPENVCLWNPESRQRLESKSTNKESGIHGVESRIQDCLGFLDMGRPLQFIEELLPIVCL